MSRLENCRFWLIFSSLFVCSLFGFDKLDLKYCIQYGNPQAQCQVVEYFSLSCPKCLEFFTEEFPSIKEKYIDSGYVSWLLHPDPADLLTLQSMVCLDQLASEHKVLFLETVMHSLAKLRENESKRDKSGARFMIAAMEVFQNPLPHLEDLEFIQKTDAFQEAYAFVSQVDVIRVIPSLEIDGVLHKDIPSLALIDAHIQNGKRAP